MEVIVDSKKLRILEKISGAKSTFYRQMKEDPEELLVKIYTKENDVFTYFLDGGNSVREIVFEGYQELPKIVSWVGFGFEEKAITNFFKFRLENSGYEKIIVSDFLPKKQKKNIFHFTLSELEHLKSSIGQEQRACNDTKNILIKNFLIHRYPKLGFDHQETNNNKELVLRNLNPKLIEKLTADDIENIGKFYIEAAKKYSRADMVKRMVKGLQKNAQLLSLQEIISKYEKLLKDNPAESVWQTFFNEYITLFDNRYYKKLDYKNIATGITKYPDLVLVDIYGYVDFYELKKSSTPILQYDKNHKTFYWSKDFSMVIAQAADYLQKAKENSLSYSKSIKDQTATENSDGFEINIINPRAIIVAGTTKELNTSNKRNHFKTLRESLKDIEFVLYDELLERLKNLLEAVKLE